jgi:hypothetical protein
MAFTRCRRAASSARVVLYLNGHAAADGFTRPPFAHPECVPEMSDGFPLARGRHHFFPKRSFNAELSSMASASMLPKPCPCCGGRMIIIETFARGCKPKHRPTLAPAVIRIDTS